MDYLNANELIKDIEYARTRGSNEYRIGTVILYKNSCGKFEVVDGQQRTITLFMIKDLLDGGSLQLEINDNCISKVFFSL